MIAIRIWIFFLNGTLARTRMSHWGDKALPPNQCPFVYSIMKWHDKIDSSTFTSTRAKSAMWVIDHSCQFSVSTHTLCTLKASLTRDLAGGEQLVQLAISIRRFSGVNNFVFANSSLDNLLNTYTRTNRCY